MQVTNQTLAPKNGGLAKKPFSQIIAMPSYQTMLANAIQEPQTAFHHNCYLCGKRDTRAEAMHTRLNHYCGVADGITWFADRNGRCIPHSVWR